MIRGLLGLITLLSLSLTNGITFGQQDEKLPEPSPPPVTKSDPTLPSDKLKDILERPKTPTPTETVVGRKFILKARVLAKGRTPMALLEVDGTLHTISLGGQFTSGGVNYRVSRLDNSQVQLMHGPKNDVINLP